MGNDKDTFINISIKELGLLLFPLSKVTSGNAVFSLMRDLGWKLPATHLFQNGFPDIISEVNALISNIYQIANSVSDEDYLTLIETSKESIETVIGLINDADGIRAEIEAELNAFPAFINDSGITTEEFPKRLLDYLLISYLQSRQQGLYGILNLLGVVEIEEITAINAWEPVPVNSVYVLRKVNWGRISDLFTDPLSVADQIYDWNPQKDFKADLFLSRIEIILRSFLLPGGLYKQDQTIHDCLNTGSVEDRELRIPLYQDGIWPATYIEAGISIAPLDKVGGPPAIPKGIGIIPYLIGITEIAQDLSENWQFSIKGSLNLNSGLGLLLRPPHDLELDTSLFTTPQSALNSRIEVSIIRKKQDTNLYLIFGSQDGSRLGFQHIGVTIIAATENNDQEVAAELNIYGLTLVIDTSNSDGFLQKILSAIKVETIVDLSIGWSNKDGVYFRGSGALEITIPIHKELGPIKLETVHITLAVDGDIEVVLAISFGAQIGPVVAAVDQIGIRIPIIFPSNRDGNLGPLQVNSPEFKPPKGAGLALISDTVKGGGFLEFDNENKQYSGILQLQFQEIGLVAVGLITTRMPDGSKGFSMLVSINVTFSPAITLPYNFNLRGVGGLVGIHRSMVVDVLRSGLKNHTLDSIMFPENPILNASKIISDLRAVFPPTKDRYVIGPMAKIGWSNPPLVIADIGIFIELPQPIRIVILGQVAAKLPKDNPSQPDKVPVVLNMDMMGVIDFEKKSFAYDATLYDSRILTYTLSGDSALRLTWGDNPNFAMAVGGLHPRFTPPPNFPTLKRLSLSLGSGNNPRINLDTYQALTSNSAQFGARLEVYAQKGDFSVQGYLGFDTLFIFSPFSFTADIGAGVSLKAWGETLMSVTLDLTLSGPTPWHAQGVATFEIFWCDYSVDFNASWGSSQPVSLEAINPTEQLLAALREPGNWSGALPDNADLCVSVRAMEKITEGGQEQKPLEIIVHPVGRLEIRQRLLPLDTTLDKFGNAPITGTNYFSITKISDNTPVDLALETAFDYFARGQFENMSNAEKLSTPSFQNLPAGVKAGSNSNDFESPVPYELEYETQVIDDNSVTRQLGNSKLPWRLGSRLMGTAAARAGAMRNAGAKKYSELGKTGKVTIKDEGYAIVNIKDMKTVTGIKGNDGTMTYAKAKREMDGYVKNNSKLKRTVQIVRNSEVQEAQGALV